jgi:hypothetical protein
MGAVQSGGAPCCAPSREEAATLNKVAALQAKVEALNGRLEEITQHDRHNDSTISLRTPAGSPPPSNVKPVAMSLSEIRFLDGERGIDQITNGERAIAPRLEALEGIIMDRIQQGGVADRLHTLEMTVLHEIRQGSFTARLSDLETIVTSPAHRLGGGTDTADNTLLEHLKDTASRGSPTGTGKPTCLFLHFLTSNPPWKICAGEYSSSVSAISAISNSSSFPPPLLTRIAALEVLVTGHKTGAVGRLIPRLETLEMAAFERVQQGDLPNRVMELESMLLGGQHL